MLHRVLAALVLLSVLAPHGARANSVEKALKDRAILQLLAHSQFDLRSSSIMQAPPSCDVHALKLRRFLADEVNAISIGYASPVAELESQAAHERAQLLLETVRAERLECYDFLIGVYAMESAFMLFTPFRPGYAEANARLIIDLIFKGSVHALTADMRAKMGGLWIKRSADQRRYAILGAYDCEKGLVWIDPTLRLGDFGGVLLHEIEHLIRDKAVYADESYRRIADPYLTLLLDETLAASHAAYSQMRLINDAQRACTKESPRPFDVTADLTLYSRTGSMQKIWKKAVEEDGFPALSSFADFFPHFVARKNHAELHQILGLVSTAYFTEIPKPSRAKFSKVRRDQARLVRELSPLVEFERIAQSGQDPSAWIAMILSRLDQPTPGCQAISRAIGEGRSGGYLYDRGTQAGHEGVRPTENVIKPGHEGVRPSENVFPCLALPGAP